MRPAVPASFRGLPPEVAALTAVAFCVAVGFGVVAPAIPLFARDFGVGEAAVGGVLSAFAFMRLASALGVGRMLNTLGERLVLATGIGIVAVSSALAGLAQNYTQLLLLRGVGGIGSAMFSVAAMSLLLRSVGAEQRAKAAGMFQGGFLLGGISGPAIGGPLAAWSIRAPFFVYAGTLVVAGAVGLWALRKTPLAARPASSRRGDHASTSLTAALRSPAYRAALVANFSRGWAAMGVRNTLVPLFVVESLHYSTTWVGAGFAIVAAMNALVLIPAGRLADGRGRRPVIVTGCVVAGLAMVMLAVTPGVAGYIGAMAAFGLGSGLLDVAPAAVVGDIAGKGGGTVVAGFQMAGDGGSVSGPVLAGWLAGAASYEVAFAVTGAVLIAAAALAVTAPDTRRPAADRGAEVREPAPG